MEETNKDKPTAISRIHKLTYGLIYPAFIGNMIYDLVLFTFDTNTKIEWENENFGIITGFFIVIFYSLDYILLHSDLDYRTTKSQKDYIYTLGDFVTSCLFFLAFVFSKFDKIDTSVICLALIPIIFLIYNWRLNVYKWFNVLFGIVSLLTMGCYFYFKPNPETFFLVMAISFTGIYFFYNLYGFWLNSNKVNNLQQNS